MALASLYLAAVAILAEPAPAPFPEEAQTAVKQLAEGRLLDAESARWRWPDYVEGRRVYCGYVNAKNKFGGYVGFAPFMVYLSKSGVSHQASDMRLPSTPLQQETLLEDCIDRGSLITPL